MSNLSKGTGSRKDTKMRIRAFPVSRSSAPGTRSRGREPHARPGLNSANRPQPASPPPRPPVAGREPSRQRGGAGRRARLPGRPGASFATASVSGVAAQKGRALPPPLSRGACVTFGLWFSEGPGLIWTVVRGDCPPLPPPQSGAVSLSACPTR